MAVQNYTDLFNTCLTNLAAKLAEVTGLRVVTDPRNITPGAGFVLVGAPSFATYSRGVANMTFPVQLISTGPSNLDALRTLLNTAALCFESMTGILEGHPITLELGGSVLPAYELSVNVQAQP
jgi:hypothetical protein